MSEEWKPEQYHDTYKDDVLALVKKKVKAGQTKTITAAEPEAKEPKSSNVVDLVALLQSSLGKRPGKGGAKPAATDDEEDEEKPAVKRTAKSTATKPKPKAIKAAAPARKPAARAKAATTRKAA
jgi:DNA end-binding protein Ku